MKIGGWARMSCTSTEVEEVARDRAEACVSPTSRRPARAICRVRLGDDPWDGGWFGPLNRALYPPVPLRRAAPRGPNCPALGRGIRCCSVPVTSRPGQSRVSGTAHLRRGGCNASQRGRGSSFGRVVGSRRVETGREADVFVRREDLIVRGRAEKLIADGRSRYDRWHLARQARARGGQLVASLAVTTAREWSAREGTTEE